VPEEIPVTTPVELTVVTPLAPELHTPPLAVLLSARVAPAHIAAVPVIAPALADGVTVIAAVALAEPQLLLTV
jgi:hypothetical protein